MNKKQVIKQLKEIQEHTFFTQRETALGVAIDMVERFYDD